MNNTYNKSTNWIYYNSFIQKMGWKPKISHYLRSEPGNIWMPKNIEKIAEKIYNFEVRPDDVWIVTYPKCGTTWTQVKPISFSWQVLYSIFAFVVESLHDME